MRKILTALLTFVIVLGVLVVYNLDQQSNNNLLPPSKPGPWEPPTQPKPPGNLSLDQALQSIQREELVRNLYLASDELEGRLPGMKGNQTAADFIRKQF